MKTGLLQLQHITYCEDEMMDGWFDRDRLEKDNYTERFG